MKNPYANVIRDNKPAKYAPITQPKANLLSWSMQNNKTSHVQSGGFILWIALVLFVVVFIYTLIKIWS